MTRKTFPNCSRNSQPFPQWHWLFVLAALAFSLSGAGTLLRAGGPVDPDGTGGFLRWNPQQPVSLVFDNGPLRSIPEIPGDDARAQIAAWAGIWEAVATSGIQFEDRGTLAGGVDVSTSNYQQYIQPTPAGNLIVFDADGGITDDWLGAGASNFTLGFATAIGLDSDNLYDWGFAVLNGKRASLDDTTAGRTFAITVVHELGHMLGLDHAQQSSEVPIMYPFVISGAPSLKEDDKAWISRLYPGPGFDQLGTIRGQVRQRIGQPFLGANVVAAPVTTLPGGDILVLGTNKVSVVSDFLFTFDGTYELPGLPPGDYAVFIERLNEAFVEGSGVGPHEIRFTDFPKDFYNGSAETGDETDIVTEKMILTVAAGETIENINLVSNETANDLSSLTDDDSEIFVFPESFRFPFYGKVYKQVSVNSDGNLTFGALDWSSFPRGVERFLGGPPRIGALFTDLNPLQTGEVTSSYDGEKLTFKWTQVPEFDRLDDKTNTFEVSLYKNGDIRFAFDEVNVSPDPDGVQIIVGTSPGGLASGIPVDLSTAPGGTVAMAAEPVFQVFRDFNFDLTSSVLVFEAQDGEFQLFFPYFQGDTVNFSGYAVTNTGDQPAQLQFEARAHSGELSEFPENPHLEELSGGEQLARVGFEIFGLSLDDMRDGWIRLSADQPGLASFFQLGNGLNDGKVTRLDGSVAFQEQAKTLYFTRILDGPDVLLTPAAGVPVDAETSFALANPNEEPIEVEFVFFNPAGQEVANRVSRQIPALGSLFEKLRSLFGAIPSVSDGYVRARVTQGPGAVGFELITMEDTLLGFNASFGNPNSTAYSAQLAHGDSGGTRIFTSLKLVNTSSGVRTVQITPLNNSGNILGTVQTFNMPANSTFQKDVGTLFSLGNTFVPAVAGSIRVDILDGGRGVIGDVVFGDPDEFRYGAALPLQTTLFRRAVFSQVANRMASDPSLATFTGLAFYNPGPNTANLTIRVFKADGEQTGLYEGQLQAGRRFSDVVASLIPASAGQERGFIEVESTEPLVAQQLFGNPSLDFLSAVPPTILQ